MSKSMKKLEKLYKCLRHIVRSWSFGFNSSGYDIKLIKKFLFKELCKHEQQPTFTIKKSGKYPCIETEHLKFLYVYTYKNTPGYPGYNLKSFFKAFGVSEQKGFIPYDYFTHADQLDETTLPPYETFHSTIKNCNILAEEHAAFQKLLNQGKLYKKPFKYYV